MALRSARTKMLGELVSQFHKPVHLKNELLFIWFILKIKKKIEDGWQSLDYTFLCS